MEGGHCKDRGRVRSAQGQSYESRVSHIDDKPGPTASAISALAPLGNSVWAQSRAGSPGLVLSWT